MSKRALISVYDKKGIVELATFLANNGWEIISTGGTSKYLQENNISVTDVTSVTGFPECLDGRVKTLHPAIHAGLLARRDVESHTETLEKLKINYIDLVCVNLYPFFEKVQLAYMPAELPMQSLEETIEFIDIGGPSMLRSAAKNFKDVIVLTEPDDYQEIIKALESGDVHFDLRRKLAGKVFSLTSAYDASIARYLLETENPETKEELPAFWPLSLKKSQSLRYGENNHQSAALYTNADRIGALSAMEQLHGKELSYNNIRDLDLAWKAVTAFGLFADGTAPMGEEEVVRLIPEGSSKEKFSCVAVKHNSPCGFALGSDILEAYDKTFACDPVSIFGGIVAANTAINAVVAEKLGELFLEIIVAPGYDEDALNLLKQKKNLRIMLAKTAPKDFRELVAVDGGCLVQETDRKLLSKWEVVTKTEPHSSDIKDLVFGMRAVTFVKSNAIMIVKDLAATGIGGGQVNRIWPAEQALKRSAEVTKEPLARVLASDAFIPFPDLIYAAAASGIKAIIQPGGSINDKDVIKACNDYEISMIFTGIRHFKH